jgi:hypothetical protein
MTFINEFFYFPVPGKTGLEEDSPFVRLFKLALPSVDAPNWTCDLRTRGEPSLHGRSGQCQRRLMISNRDLHLTGFVILHAPYPTAAGGRRLQVTDAHGWFPVPAPKEPHDLAFIHGIILARAVQRRAGNGFSERRFWWLDAGRRRRR